MAQKLSITIFVDRTPKNQTFLKTACKKVNESKCPRKDWASCAILSQSTMSVYPVVQGQAAGLVQAASAQH